MSASFSSACTLPQLPHLRGVDDWRSIGIVLDTQSNEAARMFDALLYQSYALYECPQLDGMEGTFKRMMDADPTFSMVKIFTLQSRAVNLSDKSTQSNKTSDIIANLQTQLLPHCGPWLKLHIQAAIAQAHGAEQQACHHWLDALALCPNDLLAGRGCMFYGLMHGRPDVIVSTFSQLSNTHAYDSTAYYAPVKSRLAFGLNESGASSVAQPMLEQCIAATSWDAWSHHTYAHVFDSLGESALGLNHLRQYENQWDLTGDSSMLSCHNYWHEALFACDLGQLDVALDTLDKQIMRRALKMQKPNYFQMSDVVSLLMRLEFEQLLPSDELQKRWTEINEWVCREEVDDSTGTIFYDSHICLCLLAARQPERFAHFLQCFRSKLQCLVEDGNESLDFLGIMNTIGWNLLSSIEAFFAEDYDTCTALLYPVRHEIDRVGGSRAQRDVFRLLLCHALARAPNELNLGRLRILLDEHKATRRECATADRLMDKYVIQHQHSK